MTAAAAALPPGTRRAAGPGRRPGPGQAKVAPAARPAGLCSGPSRSQQRDPALKPMAAGIAGVQAQRWAREAGAGPLPARTAAPLCPAGTGTASALAGARPCSGTPSLVLPFQREVAGTSSESSGAHG